MATESDIVTLNSSTSTCKIHLFGATVISWVCNGKEMIFVSSKSKFDSKKAIRGGIPLVFPHFGPWDLGPQHGFARISRWSLEQAPSEDDASKCTSAVFALEDNNESRKMWNFKFKLLYRVYLGENSLKTDFVVKNTGAETMTFTCLLHTYCRVPDVTHVTVSGLKGLSYTDKVKGGQNAVEERDLVTVEGEVDRIYIGTPDKHTVTGIVGGGQLILIKTCLPDTVVWNPWKEKAAAMADFDDDGYPNMICVEAGHVAEPKQLPPGDVYEASQLLTANL